MHDASIVRLAIIEALSPPSQKRLNDDDAPACRIYASTCPLPPWQFELTRIVKVVMHHPMAALLNYLYHPSPTWDDECAAVRLLWDAFCKQHSVTVRRRHRLAALCYLSIQDYRSEVVRGRSAHPVSRIQEISNVPSANWRRDWLPVWREFKRIVAAIDTDALDSLNNLIEFG